MPIRQPPIVIRQRRIAIRINLRPISEHRTEIKPSPITRTRPAAQPANLTLSMRQPVRSACRARSAALRPVERARGPQVNASNTPRRARSTLRDLSAAARDRAAELRDRAVAMAERMDGGPDPAGEAAREQAAQVRARAAADRARAAADRQHAAADRAAAAKDREQGRAQLRYSQLDGLTGAYGRALGMVALEHEINRARHSTAPLVLAFLDVDGLKQVNDRRGHAAGDALLRGVVDAIGTHLRSYDPIVRIGGDEFICALADCTLDEARLRVKKIRATLEQTHPDASISAGFGQLRTEDTLEQLIGRGDAALYEAKSDR